MYQALYRKWRPKTFDDVVGQPHVTETLKRQLVTDRISHAYLFVGTRGTGKTSCAKILAKAVNCEDLQDGNPCNLCPSCVGIDGGGILDVEELDAASNNGVDHVRALRDEAVFTPAVVKKRVYIVDEVHMLSTPAFNALLKILEEPPAHVLFILATTDAHKVPPTVLSRCQRYAFRRVGAEDIAGRLKTVADRESLVLEDDAAAMLARLADGSMRDALALLDQCSANQTIDVPLVQRFLGLAGTVETANLLAAIGDGDVRAALELVNTLYYAGKDMGALLGELAALVRDILLLRIAPKGADNLLGGGFERGTLDRFHHLPPERLTLMLSQTTAALTDLGKSANRKLAVELCVIHLCSPELSGDLDALQARMAQLEQRMAMGAPSVGAGSSRPQAQIAPPIPEAPPVPDEPPPFTDADLPPWEPDELLIPPKIAPPTPAPVSAVPEPPKPAPIVASPPSDVGGLWPQVLSQVQSELDVSVFTLLSDSKEVLGTLDGGTLYIYIENDFTRVMAEGKEVAQALTKAATAIAGTPVRIQIQAGAPTGQTQNSKLDALTQKGFGNITIK